MGLFVAPKNLRHGFSVKAMPLRREVHTARSLMSGDIAKFYMGGAENMANDVRVRVTLVCTECKQRNYDTMKNKKNDPDRLELKTHCKFCRKHTLHRESK